jgi:hypothetical protein
VSGNSDDRLVTRRDFTLESALALLAGVTITISGCGDDDSPGPTAPGPTPVADKTASISTNHGHAATITGAQISAGGAFSLNILGTATHPHTITVSPGELGAIGAGQRVNIQSTIDNNHSHTVSFN